MTSKKRRKRQNRRRVELPVTNKDKTGQVKSFTLTITLEAKPLTTTLHKYIQYIYIYKQERY
jgi:hypothetical protein